MTRSQKAREEAEAPETFRLAVSRGLRGQRLDIVLASTDKSLSRASVAKSIRDGKVTVDGKKTKASYKLREGDVVMYPLLGRKKISLDPEDISLDIIYEDDSLVVINKKAGMVVHPGKGNFTGTLVNAMVYRYGNLPSKDEKARLVRPGVVHRLDKDTSGLMVMALTPEALTRLSRAIQKREIKRSYLALVSGVPSSRKGIIDCPIGPGRLSPVRREIRDYGGKSAVTEFDVMESHAAGSLLSVRLRTGRTHQIRVHMSFIKHPILGDGIYGEKGSYPRQMLHAAELSFQHPQENRELTFRAPLPPDFEAALEELRKSGPVTRKGAA